MLRMPAISAQYESGIDTMKVRYGLWLDTLRQAGFHPMKLSDVIHRLQTGAGVPEKTVVLIFDPGLRRTYRLVAPILAAHQAPAVWLSNERAMSHGHREYVTYHAADQMVKSGWWDVGYTQDDGTIRVKSRDYADLQLGDAQHPAWSPISGGMALNKGKSLTLLSRLNVNSDWTEQDLLNRIRVEEPVEGRVFLSKAPVQNLVWGVTTDRDADPDSRFNLQVASHKRGLVLDWFGTRGIADSRVQAEGRALIGDFTMRLRWDEERGSGINILLSKDQLFIQEMQAFHTKSTYHVARSGSMLAFKSM